MDFEKPRLLTEEGDVIVKRTYAAFSPSVGKDATLVVAFTKHMQRELLPTEFDSWLQKKIADKLRLLWVRRPAIN